MTDSGAVRFSVVVAAWSGPTALARCLGALIPQLRAGDAVIVAQNFSGGAGDGGAGDRGAAAGRGTAPDVTVIRCADDTNVPRLRSAGLRASRGAVVAFLEDHAEPLAGWRDAIVAAFAARAPNSPIAAVGGPIAAPPQGAAIDDAVWFYDYAAFAPPRASSAVPSLSGANVAYDRTALLDALADDPLAAGDGVHEASVQRLLLARGRVLRLAGDAVVRVWRQERPGRALGLAFALARGFAARRAGAAGTAERAFRVLASPLVPLVLFARCARHAWRVPTLRTRFLRAAGWVLLLQGSWGLGEGIGGCFGAGRADARWR